MSDSLCLYSNIADFVFKNGMRFHDMRCFATFLWSIVGLLQSKTIHLSQWMIYRKSHGQAASKQRTLARWLDNERIQVEVVYDPLIRMMCLTFCGEGIYLALDSSVLWEKFALMRLALIYCGRAIPLSWVVVSSQSATVAFEKYEVILDRAAQVLPRICNLQGDPAGRSRICRPKTVQKGTFVGLGLPHSAQIFCLGWISPPPERKDRDLDACQRAGDLSAQRLADRKLVWSGPSGIGTCPNGKRVRGMGDCQR